MPVHRSAGVAPARDRSPALPTGSRPALASDLLQVHKEGLEFRRIGIGVADERSQGIGQPVRALAWIFLGRDADEAPVNRDADLEDLLAIDGAGGSPPG